MIVTGCNEYASSWSIEIEVHGTNRFRKGSGQKSNDIHAYICRIEPLLLLLLSS